MDTFVSLEYHIIDERIKFDFPSKGVCLQYDDFSRMFKGAREYTESLPIWPLTIKNYEVKDFVFSPLESNFDLCISSGFYSDESRSDGKVFVDFEIG